MNFTKKRIAVVSSFAGLTLATGGVALAYWSSTGTGSGTASTTAGTNDLTINSDSASGLVPGGQQTLALHIANPNLTTNEHFNTVSVVISVSNAYDVSTNPTGCKAGDFSVTGLPSNETVLAGATNAYSPVVHFANSLDDQNGCKSQTVSFAYSSN